MGVMGAIRSIVLAAVIWVTLSGAAAVAQPGRNALNADAQIYLLRGLANVFSRGMDEMAAKLTAEGFSPVVINHRGWQNAADTIMRNYQGGRTAPIILIGHSLGANNAYRIARRLNGKGIPVAYLATFDPTQRFTVPNNVRYFVNFYQNNGTGRRASFAPSRHKEKVNLNLTTSPGLKHRNIDQSRRLQDIVIARIREITAR
ncbi:MAG: thioesterase domain-containing protein [Pseudomonadota bacterium]